MIKPVLYFIISLTIFISGYIFIYNYFSFVDITITPKNTVSFTILDTSSSKVLFKSNSQTVSKIRVPKYSGITIHYTGKNNYETNIQNIKISDESKDINLDPYYSREYLDTLLEDEKDSITQSVNSYDHVIRDTYSVSDVRLYHFGEWASATLTWKGEYGQNTDSQHIILKKKDNSWSVIGEPSIVFFYKNNPDTPVDIIEQVNNPTNF